jgi:hypothetical protein
MAWVTDFCNAAYYARDPGERDVDDLRLAWCVLATRWASRSGRRLGARDLPAFNRAFGGERLRAGGRLDRRALLDGARRLLGDWFDEAYHDDRRRAHGIAFETVGARVAFDHTRLLRRGALKDLTPPRRPAEERLWATYDPVLLPDRTRPCGSSSSPRAGPTWPPRPGGSPPSRARSCAAPRSRSR